MIVPKVMSTPPEVRFQISQDKLNEYGLAAGFLNLRDPDVVWSAT